jgi:hypothetical protein
LQENIPNIVAFEKNFVVDVKLLIALDYTKIKISKFK